MNPATIHTAAVLASDGRGDHDGGGFFALLGIVLLVLAGIAIYRAVRRRRHPERYGPEAERMRRRRESTAGAEAILAERFAKGELTETEFGAARTVLRGGDDEPPAP